MEFNFDTWNKYKTCNSLLGNMRKIPFLKQIISLTLRDSNRKSGWKIVVFSICQTAETFKIVKTFI